MMSLMNYIFQLMLLKKNNNNNKVDKVGNIVCSINKITICSNQINFTRKLIDIPFSYYIISQ